MEKASGRALGNLLCKIFGEVADNTTGIVIDAQADGVATVTITRQITVREANQLQFVMRYFTLVLKNELKEAHPIFAADATVDDDKWNQAVKQALALGEEQDDEA